MMEAEFWKWKGTYKYIDTMICCSEFMKRKMDSNPLFATKTVAMHNFIDKVEWKETEKKDYVSTSDASLKRKASAHSSRSVRNCRMFSSSLPVLARWKRP